MVILIGGSSCTGKTLLANQLMKEQGITYFSVDYLKMGLYRSDEKCEFTPLSDVELIASKLWPILREMIKTYIENHIDIVIEGCYILPQFLDDFDDEYIEEIYSVFLGFSESYISSNFKSKILGYKGAIEYRSSEDERTVQQFIQDHSVLKKLCNKTGQEYFEVESDYEKEMKELKNRIALRLSKAAALKIISVREYPGQMERFIHYFQDKWASESSRMVYEDCIKNCISTSSPLPQWYILEKEGEIVGGAGLITNDFISRMDLYPWLCALRIEEKFRGNSYGKLLMDKAREDAKAGGFENLYLCTDHIGYYEKYGFEYLGNGYHPWGDKSRIYVSKL